ncbi:MAG: rod shape-determining protein RodA, partial [Coriobacteriia bacterium]|nr:rod shape-determining protein RodA [Coriobacteriia bacterium]
MVRREKTGFVRWVNVPLLMIVALLALYGSVMVHSATSGMGAGGAMFQRHLIGIALGLVLMAIAWRIDYRGFEGWLGALVGLNAFLILSPRI